MVYYDQSRTLDHPAEDYVYRKPTRCFHKIYFSEDGNIDYWLLNFRKGLIDEPKEERFKVLLNEFLNEYKFTLPAKGKFSQCGSATYN